jgi:hypothetical protein
MWCDDVCDETTDLPLAGSMMVTMIIAKRKTDIMHYYVYLHVFILWVTLYTTLQ